MPFDPLHVWAVWRSFGDDPAAVIVQWHGVDPADLPRALHRYYALAPWSKQQPGEPIVRVGSQGEAKIWVSLTDPDVDDHEPPTLRGRQIAEIVSYLLEADDPPSLPTTAKAAPVARPAPAPETAPTVPVLPAAAVAESPAQLSLF